MNCDCGHGWWQHKALDRDHPCLMDCYCLMYEPVALTWMEQRR